MEFVDSIKHTEMMEVCVMKADLSKFRFELKLWLVTNCDSMNYLRWNQDQTVLVVNVASLENCLRTKGDSIFLCRTVSDFLWLLHYNGFEACPLERLEASELDDIELDCLFFEHPQFIGSNMDIFNAWISDAHNSVHENYDGMCTVLPSSGFRRRSELPEFVNIMSKVTLRMNYVKTVMREKLLQQGSVTIPENYEDRAVMDAPPYVANMEIAGYYGAVNASDVREFLGSLAPIYYDGPEEEVPHQGHDAEIGTSLNEQEFLDSVVPVYYDGLEASEEVPHQEDDVEIGTSSNEPEWVKIITMDDSDSAEDEIIPEELHQMDDVQIGTSSNEQEFLGRLIPVYYKGSEVSEEYSYREDDVDIGIQSNEPEWVEIITIDDSDSAKQDIIEIHETYKSKEENVKIEDQHEDDEFDNTFGTKNISHFLTNCVQSCITALDSD